jgi:NADH dehydrogenase FAD-containing subunit
MVRSTLKSEFRRIDPTSAHIILVDMAERVLGAFSPILSLAAEARLRSSALRICTDFKWPLGTVVAPTLKLERHPAALLLRTKAAATLRACAV